MIQMPSVQHKTTVLRGGLDQITPSLSLAAGYVTYAVNFECATSGGYSRIKGYERKDGRASPSDGVYTIVQVFAFQNTPAVGSTLTGNTSGATGVIAALGNTWLVLTKVTGTFTSTEVVKVGATVVGTAIAQDFTVTAKQRAQYLNAVADIYRADIKAVGDTAGTGSVLGVFVYNDDLYAFRALSATPTLQGLWKATTGGWSQITFPKEVVFTTGAVATPSDGQVITGGTSGKTATVRRVQLATGAWGAAGAGRLVYTDLAGPANFTIGETITFATSGATAVVTTAGAAITLAVTTSGVTAKHECVVGNFYGQLGTLRVYGADGANRAYEFDGTYLCPITTGATPDTPKHIAVHKNYLAISIASSLFLSEVGYPYRWVTGTEWPTGDTVSGLLPQPGSQATGALGVFCRSNIFVLYGLTSASMNLVPFNVGAGAIDYTMENAGETYFFNNEGVTTLKTTLDFGNFQAASQTARILPFIIQERTKVTTATLMRPKNQYRIFFNDGYGLFVTMVNGKPQGCMPVYFPNTPNVAFEAELSTGDAVSYFGATDGYVYQMEKGTSFDGASIDAMIVLAWDPMGSPRMLKAFKRASIEMNSQTYAAIQFSYQLGYGTAEIEPSNAYNAESFTQGFALWDSMTFDEFYWDGQSILPSECDMTGTGENIQVTITSGTDYVDSFTINSLIYHYSNRRFLR